MQSRYIQIDRKELSQIAECLADLQAFYISKRAEYSNELSRVRALRMILREASV